MKKILFSISLFAALGAQAQDTTRVLTLEEAVGMALRQNYDIRLSRNDSLLAALDYSYSRYAFYPRLNGQATYLRNNNNVAQTFASSPKTERQVNQSNLQYGVNLNWPIFDGLKMFVTRQRLGELVSLGELQIRAQVVTTVADVLRNYFDMARLQQQQRATNEAMALSQERLKLAQYRFDIGTGIKSDVLQAQIDLNGQRSALLSQQNELKNIREQLNRQLTLVPGTSYRVQDSIPVNPALRLDSVQAALEAGNPQLLLNQKQIDIAKLAVKERKAERFPTVSLTSAYNFNRTNNSTPPNNFSPLLNQSQGFNYGITTTIPIFNGFVARRNIKSAQLEVQNLELQYESSKALVGSGIITAYQNYDLARQTLQLEESNIALIRENLTIARERYRLGLSTFLELRTAEQNLYDAQSRLIQARFNMKAAEIELGRIRGDIVR
ncbi:TolC family protein [Flaviaesturariibacter flavus]|uniref:TolC family protein n=1 Tax=Flaviaesturariibacter flavus TaxID=2502780 RepID=A0A4R1B9Y3_9BACT|nr:TolC family protein [Flaviaesturariibacter flavus]TCJ13745.1 TolC family protein [Flaviaesturariibacter flavus]